jgi:tetratricopeptide (TPR) repeat protein
MTTFLGRDLQMRNEPDRRGPAFRRAAALLASLALGLGSTACEFLDPTNVENPRTTVDDLARAEEPTAALLAGLRAQFARTIESVVVTTECVSDNYSIHGTGLFKEWDFPRDVTPTVNNSTGNVTGVYWNPQELRALADFVINDIIPDDETSTAEDIAWAHYFRGMANLYLGENFSHVPLETDGAPLPASEILARASTDLEQAASAGGEASLPARAALARTYRRLGNASQAVSYANQVLGSDPAFLFTQGFDATSIENTPHWYLVSRALQEMQPLPRLDLLDPKYLTRTADIPVAKAEEMHLILAEAALAAGNYGEGKLHLGNAIRLAQSRSVESFVDDDPRNNADLSIRPRDDVIEVRADASSPYRPGLVLNRNGATIDAPVISGTSLDADSVEALPDGDGGAIWHAFWLARQEILFLEGHRMADLGIRLPMMLRELDTNPNIADGDPGTVAVVPGYIPPADEMDLFTPASPYDGEALVETQVTILHDMNKILTQNAVSPFQ